MHPFLESKSADVRKNIADISHAYIDNISINGSHFLSKITSEDDDYSKSGNVLDSSAFVSDVVFIWRHCANHLLSVYTGLIT